MSYSQDWLNNTSSRKCLLAEITVKNISSGAAVLENLYMSTSGYLTTSSDVFFMPVISGGAEFTESMSLDGSISISYGDLELLNPNGDLDKYLDSNKYIWVNGSINLYYGDPTWVSLNLAEVKVKFKQVFAGVISDVDSVNKGVLNVKLLDKLQRLNTPITEAKLGPSGNWGANAQTNADSITPIVFGEVFNMEPMLIDPSLLKYQVNTGVTEGIIEVRDNGVPVELDTFDANTGILTLKYPPVGTVTCSVQGVRKYVGFPGNTATLFPNTYLNNNIAIIGLIATQYGLASSALSLSDLDAQNLSAVASSIGRPIGVLVTDRENTLEVCNRLAASTRGQVFMTRSGLLQVLVIGTPTQDPVVEINSSYMILGTFNISNRSTVAAATKVGYAKNWTVQSGLVTAIPQQHKDNYATEWFSKTVTDTATKDTYKLTVDPVQIDTALIRVVDAEYEAILRNNFSNVKHTVYSFTGTSRLLSLKLGQQVTLKYNRFGLDNGKACQVVSLKPNWLRGTVDIEAMTL